MKFLRMLILDKLSVKEKIYIQLKFNEKMFEEISIWQLGYRKSRLIWKIL